MKTSFKIGNKVKNLFLKKEVLWATEIANMLWISRVITHKALNDLIINKSVKKIGKWPQTKYKSLIFDENYFSDTVFIPVVWYANAWNPLQKKDEDTANWKTWRILNFKEIKILEDYFYKFTPEWRILTWYEWIKQWCSERNMNLEDKILNFISVKNHIEKLHNNCGLIPAINNFWKHFEKVYLDEIYYADQYNWMEFWRWKLAEMTFYAKQSQNKNLIWQANSDIFLKLKCVIESWNFDAIAITPWSIDRKNQLLWLLKNVLYDLGLPFVNIIKYYESWIAIPQKSLKTRQQRISNARNTIFVKDDHISQYKKVFLIDDFVWSWSTLNETAKKLKDSWVEEVVWFAYVWNLNLDYEVINEV